MVPITTIIETVTSKYVFLQYYLLSIYPLYVDKSSFYKNCPQQREKVPNKVKKVPNNAKTVPNVPRGVR
jgi:hypothetical protein